MNEILYIIGIITIGYFIVKLLLTHDDNKESKRIQRTEMIKNSSSCKSFIRKNENLMTKNELDKAIDEYLKTPEAKEEIQKNIDSNLNFNPLGVII